MTTHIYNHLSPTQQQARATAENNQKVAEELAANSRDLIDDVRDIIDSDRKDRKDADNPLPVGKARRAIFIGAGEKIASAYRMLHKAFDVSGDAGYRVEASTLIDATISEDMERIVDLIDENKHLSNVDKVRIYEEYKHEWLSLQEEFIEP